MGAARPLRASSRQRAAADPAPYLAAAHRRLLADEAGIRWRRRPASLVFGDVSGCTALVGTVAAEELTDVLNGAMGRLLDAAAGHGGDLLKYGGDAVLLAFEGPGHERRATQAAAALPAALRGLPGDAPGVQLEMSIGVATGELDLFLLGDDHRELVVGGPLVTTAVRLEHEADPGQVLADGSTAAAVNDARWSGLHRGGHVLLIPPPASTVGLGLSANGYDPPAAQLRSGLPADLRDHVGGGADGEHRRVAVACIQVMGVDDLLDRAGHAAVANALDAVVRTAQEACATHHTTFLSTEGDDGAVRLILTAGAPNAGTDDVGRLLLAARKVVAADGALPVRAGVHHGPAFAVEVGSQRRRVYAVLGDAPHLAAHVMRHSEPGAVVATDSSLAASRTRFGATALNPFAVPGQSEVVVASTLGRPLGEGAHPSATAQPLVGRDEELAILLTALQDARAGHDRTVVIAGEDGIGKSRLVAEVIAAAPDLPHLHVAGGTDATGCPYVSARDSLRRLLGLDPDAAEHAVVSAILDVVGPKGERWLPLVAPAFGVMLPDTAVTALVEPRFRRSRSHILVTALLRKLLPDRALLVVEDAQWLDHASTELLHHLLGAFAGAPWMVLVCRRDQPGGLELSRTHNVTHVELRPLDPEGAATLLHAGSPDLPDRVLDALLNRGGGNPLFLEQLRALVASGTDVDALPATLEAAIAARIDALDAPRRRQLRAASLLGPRFPTTLLASIVDDTGGDPARSLAAFLEPDDASWMRFRHPLVRDVAHAGLSQRVRRDLHGQVGALIEPDPSDPCARAERLSLHTAEAQQWEPAWRWSVLAAERSAAAGATVEAAHFLRRALAAAGHLDVESAERSQIYELLAETEEVNGRLDEATDALTRARRLADEPVRIAHLLHRHGRVSDRAGSYVAAQRWFARGLRELANAGPTPGGELVRIDLIVSQAGTKIRQGRLREAVPLLEGAAVDAEAAGHRAALALACSLLSTVLHDLGRTEEASQHLDRAAPLFEELGDLAGQAAAHSCRGVEAYRDGDWDMAAARWRRAATLYEQAGDLVNRAKVLASLGEVPTH